MIEKIKNIAWLVGIVFTVSAFIQTLVGLSPRVTKLEERASTCDEKYSKVNARVSGIEIKLDTLISKTDETGKDVKDLYMLILERHK